MQHHQSYIFSLCQQISEKGLQPSVALIRSKANKNLTIPEVICALKCWKEDPLQCAANELDSATTETPTALTLAQRVSQLEQQVLQLQQQLKQQQKD